MQIFEIQEPGTAEVQKKREIAVGIDFGTTNSLVAYSVSYEPYVIGDNLVPSIIAEDLTIGDGDLKSVKRLIGKSLSEIIASPEIPSSVKERVLEENGVLKLKIAGKNFTIAELIALILKHLKNKAEDHLKSEVSNAVITVPAHFDDSMRNLVKHAASLAGLEVLRLISEPTAAAYAYGLENGSEGIYSVYDFGGGTFDVSLLRMQMGVFQVLATGGDISLGGDDIDHVLFEHLQRLGITREQAKAIKEHLSERDTDHINRETFEQLVTPIIERTIKITNSVIEKSLSNLKGIILVGGSTRIPLIRKFLARFNVPILDSVDPDKVVALGAALQAENLSGGSKDLIIDVVPLSLGMELMGGIAEKIILRNSPIPTSVTKEFTTYADNQTAMQFNIVQGEREMVKDCRSLAKFELKNIPAMKAGAARIDVTFNVDADGLLSITAIEKVTGIKQIIEVRPTYGISEGDVVSMLKDSYSHAEDDHQLKLLMETKIEAEQEIAALEAALEETPDLVNKGEIKKIENKIWELQTSIKSQNRDNILKAVEALEVTSKPFIEARMDFVVNEVLRGKKV